MPINLNQILTWCGVVNARRAAVTAELMPNGLSDLDYFSTEDIQTAIKGFPRNPVLEADRFSLSAACTKRITQLALWVKDQIRADVETVFANNYVSNTFLQEIGAAQIRENIRKARIKTGESLTTQKIDPPLKTSGGWDAWSDAVKAALGLSYGARGVPLLYIIRPEREQDLDQEHLTWEENAIARSPHAGEDYKSDLQTVHVFLLNNIPEDSDAYAYIQPHIAKNDGRRDWLALQSRYESPAYTQAKVAEANQMWDKLCYKNERAMSFEVFSRKLSQTLQTFARAGRAKHEEDIVDWLWAHIQCPELSALIGGLKATQNERDEPRTHREILAKLAKEIPNLNKAPQFARGISEIHSSSGFTFDGRTPATGAHTADGKLFCGGYSTSQWRNDEQLAPYKSEILALREKNPHLNGKKGKNKGGKKDFKQAKRKLQQVKQKLKTATRKLAALQTDGGGNPEAGVATVAGQVPNPAGDAFGGRAGMAAAGGARN